MDDVILSTGAVVTHYRMNNGAVVQLATTRSVVGCRNTSWIINHYSPDES
jgi:hypothetical protein